MENMTQEQVKNVIIEGYINVLKRWPDKSGMETYSKLLISKELIPEQFFDILINSDEYKEKFGSSIRTISSIIEQKSGQDIPLVDKADNDKSVKSGQDIPLVDKADNDKSVKADNDKSVKADNDKSVKADNDKSVKADNDNSLNSLVISPAYVRNNKKNKG